MDIVGSIETNTNNTIIKETMFTYSEEEKQEKEINKANADLVFSPKFIPFYPKIMKDHNLSFTETILFGFIDFFLNGNNKKFYFTDIQLSEIISCGESTISGAIKKLSEIGLIIKKQKMRAGGGTIRFIQLTNTTIQVYQPPVSRVSRVQEVGTNNNNINNNNKKEKVFSEKKEKKTTTYNTVFEEIRSAFPEARSGNKREAYEEYKENRNEEDLKQEIKILKRQIKSGVVDGKFLPAMQRRLKNLPKPTKENIEIRTKAIMIEFLKTSKEDLKEFVKDFGGTDGFVYEIYKTQIFNTRIKKKQEIFIKSFNESK